MYMLYRPQMIKGIIYLFTMNTPLAQKKVEQKGQQNQTSDILEKRVEDYVMFILIL